jgi:glutathione-regulated potassium-efflux system ancillary protein KefG
VVSRTIAVDDLIDAAHVAAAIGLTHRNSVATYMRRYRDFPRPLVETEGGRCRLWSRAEVEQWLASRRTAGKVRHR